MPLISVPYISQQGRYPTGCESVSAVMLLQYLGYPITVEEFIHNALPQEGFIQRDGLLYGPDPRVAFCGSPYEEDAFGCYAPVICTALNSIMDSRHRAVDETGASMEYLLHTYIDHGMPVIFWACINMRPPLEGPSWRLHNTDTDFTWISNEHCMLLVGYDRDGYYFNDPYGDNGIVCYEKALTEARHCAQHCMAVGIQVCASDDVCSTRNH